MKRAAIYVRMSTSAQQDSPERQLSQILPYCQRKGYAVINQGRYTDLAMTGDDESRPGLKRLIEDAQAGLFEVIVVDEPSRLSRKDPITHIQQIVGPLRDAGVLVDSVSVGETNWDNLGGFLTGSVLQFKSNEESVDLGRRLTSQMYMKASQSSVFLGKTPYGYRRDKEGDDTRLVPGDPAEVRAVQLIFDLYVNKDYSLGDISRELHSRGVLSPRGLPRWQPTTIRNLLVDPKYMGTYTLGRAASGKHYRLMAGGIKRVSRSDGRIDRKPKEEWAACIENSHEPLVDRATWERAQSLLKGNRKRTSPAPRRGDYLFVGLLVCPECGGPMVGLFHPRAGQKVRSYRCTGSSNGNDRCNGNLVREQQLLDGVLEALQTRFNAEFVCAIRKKAAELVERHQKTDASASLSREAEGLRQQIAQAKRKLVLLPEDCIPESVATIRTLETRLRGLEEQLGEVAEMPEFLKVLETYIEQLERDLWLAREVLLSGERDKLRRWLRAVVSRVEVELDRREERPGRNVYWLKGGRVYVKGPCPPAGLLAEGEGGKEGCFILCSTDLNTTQATAGFLLCFTL